MVCCQTVAAVFCRGVISLENKTFVIEPASGGEGDAHFIYRAEHLRLAQGDCGHGFNMTSVPLGNHIRNPFQSFHTRVRTSLLLSWILSLFY